MPEPDVGAAAPGFTLPGTGGRSYSLADYRGRPVVLVFYPGDFTPVCTRQLSAYRESFAAFEDLDAQVLALSPQDLDSHERFSDDQGLPFPLLADTDKAVGRAYGIVSPIGFYRRSVFVVDGAGVVRYAHRSRTSLGFRPADELVQAVVEARHPHAAPRGS